MKFIKNERGSSLVYLLWIFTATIVLFLIITNIARVYIVKQQASAAAELAALAATGDVLAATEDAINEFDRQMEALTPDGVYYPLWDDIQVKVDYWRGRGDPEHEALLKAYNEILPSKFGGDPIDLKAILLEAFRERSFKDRVYSTVQQIIRENEGNEEHVEVKISTDKFRVEVKTDATYKTLTDGSLLDSFEKDIPQEGFGPSLDYLRGVIN